MKYTVLSVEVLDDDKGQRAVFEFGDEKECVAHAMVFMLNDTEKALKSTTIWTRNLLPDLKVPNVRGLMKFKKIEEEDAQEQVLKSHIDALKTLVDKEVDIYTETNYVNGNTYTNWVPYEPAKRTAQTAMSDEEVAVDSATVQEGF
jgi:hypothetical protein